MISEENKRLLWYLDRLEESLQATIRDIQNEKNKIILEEEHHEQVRNRDA